MDKLCSFSPPYSFKACAKLSLSAISSMLYYSRFYPFSTPTYFPYISFKTVGLFIRIVYYYKICICDMYSFIMLY